MQNFVIIGNSAAGISAATAIRKKDKGSKITVISNEPYNMYSRPLISYKLEGLSDDVMYSHPADFYSKNNITTLFGRNVVSVDDTNKSLSLDDNSIIKFDKLLVASGGEPILPPFVPKDEDRVMTFTKWDDTKKITQIIDDVTDVVVIGGGLIGIKATEGLHYHRKNITIVELAERIMSPVIDNTASDILISKLNENGVKVKLKVSAKNIIKKNDKMVVELSDGEFLEADLVIVAVGVRPATSFLRNTNIKIDRGIVVNEFQETSVKDIYAAGDCSQGKEIISGELRTLPLWPNANNQGKIAGLNMVGEKKENTGSLSMNSVDIFGLPSISAGVVNPDSTDGYEILLRYDKENQIYKKIVVKNDVVVGYIFIKEIDRSGIFTGLIKDKVDIKAFKEKLLDEDFGYISFPKEMRKKKIYAYYEV